ncbi:MAG TPA: MinD/ParA family protein, partial [Diaminobutyricibacter sp.]
MAEKPEKRDAQGQVLESESTDEAGEFHGELPPGDGDDLAVTLPESLSIVVDLPPAPSPEIPEDEVAVAIDDVPVNPGFITTSQPTTMSMAIPTPRVSTGPTATIAASASAENAEPVHHADQFSQSRRDRLRGEHSTQPEPAAMLTADRLLEVNRKTRP